MADLAGPFGSGSWSQTEWYGFAPTWAPSGIIGTPAASVGVGDFAVTASGLTVTVACNGDRAWIDGSGYKPDTNKTLPVTANGNASLSRRDRLVIRRDLAAQTIDVVRLPGTAAGTPAAPDLTQITGGIYDVPICSFLVPPNNGTTLTGFIDERSWVTPSGLAVANTAARNALDSASPQYARALVTEVDTGRVLQSDGAKWVKVGGPREVLLNNGNLGNSGAVAVGASAAVANGTATVPVAANTGRIEFMFGAAPSAGAQFVVTLAVDGVTVASQTVNASTQVPVPLGADIDLAAGSRAWAVTLTVNSGAAVSMSYSGIRVTI